MVSQELDKTEGTYQACAEKKKKKSVHLMAMTEEKDSIPQNRSCTENINKVLFTPHTSLESLIVPRRLFFKANNTNVCI